jgi:hypothetical protein
MGMVMFIILLIGLFVFLKIRDKEDNTDKNMFPPQGKEYTKRLETYMKTTRSALLLYDQSDHSPEMAMLTLEAMRRELMNVATIMIMPTEEEHIDVKSTLRKIGKLAHTAYHKGI